MNEFKTILTKLKEITRQQLKPDTKVLDKDIAFALGNKPTSFASYKSRNKPPYKAILTYCHNNRLDVRKILFNEDEPIVSNPSTEAIETGKTRVKHFKTLDAYSRHLSLLAVSTEPVSF